jgi:hypothetical protein
MKDYKLSPKIKELIEKKKGIVSAMSNVEAENIVAMALKGTFNKDVVFNKQEKTIISQNIHDINPNDYELKNLDNISIFIKKYYNNEEITNIVKNILRLRYKPGMVIYNIRVYNSHVIYFLSSFQDSIKCYQGILLNISFIGDMKKIFLDIEIDENGTITNDDIIERLDDLINDLKLEFPDLLISIHNNVYVLASENKETIETIQDRYSGLKIELVPEYFFNWK